MSKRPLMMAAGAALLLSACSETATIPPTVTFNNPPTSAAQDKLLTSITKPYLSFAVYLPANDKPMPDGEYYIRLSASYLPAPPIGAIDPGKAYLTSPISYDQAKRTLFERIFADVNRGFTLTANLTVDGTKITVPLYAFSHDSGPEGEKFSDDGDLMWKNTYIKVSNVSTVSAVFDAQFLNATTSGAVGAALRVAKVAVGAVNPAAKVLTTLNQSQLQKEGQIWDAALGKALSSSVEEKVDLTVTPEQAPLGSYGILTVAVPGPDVALFASGLDPRVIIGQWRVEIQKARRSLFSDDPVLDGADWYKSALTESQYTSPSRVLNEQLGNGKTVEAFIKADKVNDTLTAAAIASGAEQSADMESYCNGVVDDLEAVGLTTVDARLGLWAVIEGMSLPGKGLKAKLETACATQAFPFQMGLAALR